MMPAWLWMVGNASPACVARHVEHVFLSADEAAMMPYRTVLRVKSSAYLAKRRNAFSIAAPDKKREMLVYPGGLPLYLQKCKESADAGYAGFVLS